MRKKFVLAAGTAAAAGAGAAAYVALRAPSAGESAPLDLAVLGGEERSVKTQDGAEIAVTVAGHPGAKTFVLAHGWTCDRTSWVPVAQKLLEAGNRVVLYDQRGHGGSTVGGGGLTIEALGDDLAAVLEDIDARGAVVAGHSMGGMSAQSFAVRYPEILALRVDAMALVSTACDSVGMRGAAGSLARRALVHPALERMLDTNAVGPWLMRGALGSRPQRPHLEALRATFAGTPHDTRTGFFDSMCAMDLSPSLADLDAPVAVAVGSRDLLTPPARSRRLAELINGARLEVFAGAGHMLPLEVPDRLADLLQEI